MADLVTHLCSGLLPAAIFAPRWMGPVALGAVLPDLSGRVPQIVLSKFDGLPMGVVWAFDVAHTPVAQVLLCGIVAMAFATRRGAVFGALLVGVAAHFLLDVLQNHHGHGYHLLFPFDSGRYELGWIGSEATVAYAPWVLLCTLPVVGWRVWSRRH